ncbi:MAG: hypothetical protein AABY22_03720, partial [Nanoarchaeota archaeon]
YNKYIEDTTCMDYKLNDFSIFKKYNYIEYYLIDYSVSGENIRIYENKAKNLMGDVNIINLNYKINESHYQNKRICNDRINFIDIDKKEMLDYFDIKQLSVKWLSKNCEKRIVLTGGVNPDKKEVYQCRNYLVEIKK